MYVGGDNAALDFQLGGTTQGHVFADGCNGRSNCIANRRTGRVSRALEGFDIHMTGGVYHMGDITDQALKGFVAGHEIGFGIQLDNHALRTGGDSTDQTFSRNAT